MSAPDLRQQPNPHRSDGRWIKVQWHQQGNKYFGMITLNKKFVNLPTRPTPSVAALDTDKVIYKVQGPDAETNGTLTPEVKAELDGMTLEEVVAQIKATGGNAFSRGKSAYRGVSWHKKSQRWQVMFNTGAGKRMMLNTNTELEAAQQYDAWCKQHGRPLSWYNFPPAADGEGPQEIIPSGSQAAAPAAGPPAAAAAASGGRGGGGGQPAAARPAGALKAAAAADAADAATPSSSTDQPATAAGMNMFPLAAAAPVQHDSSSSDRDTATAAATSAGTTDAAAALQVGTTQAAAAEMSSSSLWQQWAEGAEGGWWTDSSDWEEEVEADWADREGDEAAGQPGVLRGAAVVSEGAAAAADAGSSAGVTGAVQSSQGHTGAEAVAALGAAEATRAAASMLAAGPAAAATAGGDAASAAASTLKPTTVLTAWQQLHGGQPMPPATMALLMPSGNVRAVQSQSQQQQQQQEGSMLAAAAADAVALVQLTSSSGGSSKKGSIDSNSSTFTAAPVDADAVHGSSRSSGQGGVSVGQQQGLGLTPAVIAAAEAARVRMASALREASAGKGLMSPAASTGEGMCQFGSSNSVGAQKEQQQESGDSAAAQVTAAALPAAISSSRSSTATRVLTIKSASCEALASNPLLTTAAIARAAAAVTQHPRTIRSADRAVAAAGDQEPPPGAVADIESALRTAATQAVQQLQPGGSHYWRGKKAWKHSKHTACSSSSTAAAAAAAAAKAADPDAAVAAAIAAAEAAGRGCSAADLHAAWLMQRLGAGLLMVTVRRPAVSMEALEQALADHGVEVMPGLDYEPVPGLHPELYYPHAKPAHTNTSTKAAPAALAVAPAAAEPSQVIPGAAAASAEDVNAALRDQAAAGPSSEDTAERSCSNKPNTGADANAEHTDQGPTAAQAGSKDTAAPMDTTPAAEDTNPDTAPVAAPAAAAPADSTPKSPSTPAAAHAAPAATAAAAKQTSATDSPAGPPAAATAAAVGTASGGIDWSAALAAAEEAAAASEAYPYPLPCDRTPFDAASSEAELPYEADWVAGIIQGKNLSAAAAAGPTPPYGSSSTASKSGPAAAAAVDSMFGGAGAGGSVDGGRQWDPADHRRQHRERMGFSTTDIPTINMNWTGEDKADTIAFLQAVVAEGDADHLPSHIRAYRIAEMVKQKDPGFPLEELTAMGRPIEGEYCPVVLGVPPPDPNTPAAAATAAASVHRPAARAKVEDAFDPVNRRPPQVLLLLPGCSYSGQKAATRRATAAARAAMLPAEEPTAAVGLAAAEEESEGVSAPSRGDRVFAFERITMLGAGQLVQQLRPVRLEDARAPGAAAAAGSADGQQQQQEDREKQETQGGDGGVTMADAAPIESGGPVTGSGSGRRIVKAARRSKSAAAASDAAGETVVAAAAYGAAAKLRSMASCNDAPVTNAAPLSGKTGSAAGGPSRCAGSSGSKLRAGAAGKTRSERIQFLQEMQRKARAALAAATSARAVAAGRPDCFAAAEDEHLSALHPSLLAAAAEAASEAAAAALQPQPMEVDWVHEEDMVRDTGLWEPAEQRVQAAHKAAVQAAKDKAAALAAAAAAPGVAARVGEEGAEGGQSGNQPADMQLDAESTLSNAGAHPNSAAAAAGSGAAAAAGASSKGGSSAAGSSYLQEQVGLLMGFIKADSCPAISAAEEAALGLQMPRPLAIVHNYCSAAPAAGAAAAAVAALVPGGSLTYSSSEEYPTAGSAGDVTRVSYGAAEKVQRGIVDDLAARVQQLRNKQEFDEGLEAAFQAGGPEAAAAFMAAADAAAEAEDPNAWIDSWTTPTPAMAYARAGGSGQWPDAAAAVSQANCESPAVVAACELGLKISAAATAQLERRLDAQQQQQEQGVDNTNDAAAADLSAVVSADQRGLGGIIARVLPRGMSLRAQQNALLAYRAASRMQMHLLGHDFSPDDVFDLYYEIKLPRDADEFWGRIARGEVGQGQEGFSVPQPRVRFYENQELWGSLDGEEKQRVLDAELRWEEECRIVQEARRMQLHAMTAPGAILHDIVLGAGIPVAGLDPFCLGEAARHIINTTPVQRVEGFVQRLMETGDTEHVGFWQQQIEELKGKAA